MVRPLERLRLPEQAVVSAADAWRAPVSPVLGDAGPLWSRVQWSLKVDEVVDHADEAMGSDRDTVNVCCAAERGSFAMPNDETGETPIQDTLELMTAASIENCRLDARELMLVRLAALVAVDAPSPSYVMSIGAAAVSDPGITLEDAQDILVAVAPIVGTTRVVSATVNMGKALGFVIGEIAEAEMEANEG